MVINFCANSKIESSKYIPVHIWHFLSELNKNLNEIIQPVCEYAVYRLGAPILRPSKKKKKRKKIKKKETDLFLTPRSVEMSDSAKYHP